MIYEYEKIWKNKHVIIPHEEEENAQHSKKSCLYFIIKRLYSVIKLSLKKAKMCKISYERF